MGRCLLAGMLLMATGCHAPAPSLSMLHNPPIVPPPGTGSYGTAAGNSYYQPSGQGARSATAPNGGQPSAGQGAWSAPGAGEGNTTPANPWPVAQASYGEPEQPHGWAPIDGFAGGQGVGSTRELTLGGGSSLRLRGMPVNDATHPSEPRAFAIPPDAQPLAPPSPPVQNIPVQNPAAHYLAAQGGNQGGASHGAIPYQGEPYAGGSYGLQPLAAPQYGLAPGQYVPGTATPAAGGSFRYPAGNVTTGGGVDGWKSRYEVGNGN